MASPLDNYRRPPTIKIYRGEFRQELITVTDLNTGDPVDLTGATLHLTVWDTLDADAPACVKLTDDGIVHGDQASSPGQAVVTFDPVDTAAMVLEVGVFVLWIVDAAGNPQVAIPPSPFVVREARVPVPESP